MINKIVRYFSFIIAVSVTSNVAFAGPPPIPTNVVATPMDGAVKITWDNSAAAHAYNLYWSTNPGVNIKNLFDMKVPNIKSSPFTQQELANGIKYYFVVQAINHKGSSYGSTTVSATPNSANQTINVFSAIYGDNCNLKPACNGDVTEAVASACNGKKVCSYKIDHNVLGDPSLGCKKDFTVKWKCDDSEKERVIPGEASGQTINLSCSN